MKKQSKIAYSEPSDYFPKSVRKKAGLGEFAGTKEKKATTTKKTVKRK